MVTWMSPEQISPSANQPPDLAEAQRLAAMTTSDFHAELAAGKALLFGSGHKVSLIVEAEKCFRRALAQSPVSAEATTYVGWSLDNQGRWTEAKEYYERALLIRLLIWRMSAMQRRWRNLTSLRRVIVRQLNEPQALASLRGLNLSLISIELSRTTA
jgi:tetratricopeptide (TPR) repeat protein